MIPEQLQAQAIWETIPLKTQQVLIQLYNELLRARSKHPMWPACPVQRSAIVCEESGELARAALQYNFEYKGQGTGEMRAEATHVGAMAMRFLLELDNIHALQTLIPSHG